MSQQEDESYEAKLNRASEEGCIWLNPIVQRENNYSRLFRTRGPVVSRAGKVWMVISFFLTGAILSFIRFTFGDPFFIGWAFFSWPAIIIWMFILGWQGRRISNISPYRLRTGEGSFTWFKLFVVRLSTRLSWLWGRPKAFTQTYTIAGKSNGEPSIIDSAEYIGTARCPEVIYNHTPRPIDEYSQDGALHDGRITYLYSPAMSERMSISGTTSRRVRIENKKRVKRARTINRKESML